MAGNKKATQRGKMVRAIQKTREPRRKPRVILTRNKMLNAIQNSGGILSEIQKRTGAANTSVVKSRIDRDPILTEAYEDERDRILDTAENTVKEMMEQRTDPTLAANTAKWYLDRQGKQRGYGNNRNVTIGGNGKPIEVENRTMIAITQLPLETRRKILREIEDGGNGRLIDSAEEEE